MLADIKNFRALEPDLATAGQPDEAQLADVKRAGFDVVINLGLAGQPYSLPDEQSAVEKLGLAYFHLPVDFERPQAGDLERFLEIMDRCDERKVLVHCAANYRASCFTACYLHRRRGWSSVEAEASVHRVWIPNAVWRNFMQAAKEKGQP